VLFIGTTLAGASTLKTNDKNVEPCSAIAIPPGMWYFHFTPKGNFSFSIGEWKHVEKGESVTFKTTICFYQVGAGVILTVFDGKVVKIPGVASKIVVTLKEREKGGEWQTICNETITKDKADSDGFYNHKFTKSYSEDKVYQVMASARAYGTTLSGEEIFWDSGGGKFFTLTIEVGNAKTKGTSPTNLLFIKFLQQHPYIFLSLQRFLNLPAFQQ